jgi:plastocyanin
MKTAKLFFSPLRREKSRRDSTLLTAGEAEGATCGVEALPLRKSRRDSTLLTVCFSLRAFSLRTILLPALMFFSCASLHAQVTIGGTENPRAGALLDLNSTDKGGLLLSNVTISDPELIPVGNADVFPGITPANADVNPDLRGAMVYNDGQDPAVPAGIYIWNGYCWTKDGGDRTVTVPSITANGSTGAAVAVVEGGSVTFAVVSPQADVSYQWFSNTSPSTSGGTPEGTGSSYTTQALTAGTYYYYCTATSASCPSFNAVSSVITVTVIPNPVSLPVGDGTFLGKTCFDVVQINDDVECGLKMNRESKKHSFSNTPTETYMFTPTGSPTGLMFAYTNLDALHPVIAGISQNGNEVTVTFYPGLDAAAAGLTRAEALKAELYAVFMDGDVQKQLTLTLSVSDCQCCPGLFIPGGEYSDIAATTALPSGSTANNTDGRAANFLLTSTAANGFANNKTGYGLCYYYRSANPSGTGSSSPTRYIWVNARTVCQTVEGIDAADAHGDWRLPNLGELAQIGQLVSNNADGAINAGIGSQAEINKAISGGPDYSPYGYLPAGTVTANGTYNITQITYWSSTRRSADAGWGWDYNSSLRRVYSNSNSSNDHVRCVRRF